MKYLSPEKVYIHTDRDVYGIGDTIWFKGYIVNSSPLSDYPESRYIYVDVIANTVGKNFKGAFENVSYAMRRIKVKLRDNVLEGYLAIPEDANTGYALVRAYTYWNLNKSEDYVFTKEISIINPIKDSYVEELKKKTVKSDTFYEEIGMENPFHKIKTVKKIDGSLLPESGRLLAGISNRIGVKVIDNQGLGCQAFGKVYDSKDTQVASFTTDEYGFGSFMLAPVSAMEKYWAEVEDVEGISIKVKLPPVEKDGVGISLRYAPEMIETIVEVCGAVDPLQLRFVLSGPSEVYYNVPLNGKRFNLPLEGMPYGVNNVIVCTSSGKILAKRPFFVMPKGDAVRKIEYNLDKPNFKKRDNIGVSIGVGGKDGGNFSVSVTDNLLSPSNKLNNNIISYMFLTSEIRGNVENPQRFFCDTIPLEKRLADIDLMLMTQGWEYYDLPSIFSGNFPVPKFGREYRQSISGVVKHKLLKNKKGFEVFFVAPAINYATLGTVGPEGNFELVGIDFPDSTKFFVSATNKSHVKRYRTLLKEDSFAPLARFVHNREKVAYTPEVAKIVTENYYGSGGDLSYQLDAITVYGRKRPIKGISPYPNWEFRSDQIRENLKLEPYKAYDIISYLVMTCPGLREGETTKEGARTIVCRRAATASSFAPSRSFAPVTIYIDGLRMLDWWEINGLNVDDVETVVYLRGGEAAPFDVTAGGFGNASSTSIVLIKTKPIIRQVWYISTGMPLGWQIPKKFYSPKYEVFGKDVVPSGADRRSTLYWNPFAKASDDGKISFRFYSSDLLSGYTVTVEGINSDGELVSGSFVID